MSENVKIAIGVAITAVVMLVFNFVVGLFSAGLDAQAVKQIKEVVTEEMTLPDKRSFAQAIISMEKSQSVTAAQVNLLVGRATGLAAAEEATTP